MPRPHCYGFDSRSCLSSWPAVPHGCCVRRAHRQSTVNRPGLRVRRFLSHRAQPLNLRVYDAA